jgi:alkylation response protein AidB-like acyl-CoA dehydrogenase
MNFTEMPSPASLKRKQRPIVSEGQGFSIARHNLAEERLGIAVSAAGACADILASLDPRIRRIADGSSEVMREIISRKIFA